MKRLLLLFLAAASILAFTGCHHHHHGHHGQATFTPRGPQPPQHGPVRNPPHPAPNRFAPGQPPHSPR